VSTRRPAFVVPSPRRSLHAWALVAATVLASPPTGHAQEPAPTPDPSAREDTPASPPSLERGRRLVEAARKSLDAKDPHKTVKRLEAAIPILEAHAGEPAVGELRFRADWMLLVARFRKNEGGVRSARPGAPLPFDLASAFAEIRERHPKRLEAEHFRSVALDLAYTRRYEDAVLLLLEAAEAFPQQAASLQSLATFVGGIHEAVQRYDGPESTIDDGYRAFFERTRPQEPEELYQYALRASSMKEFPKTLLALREAGEGLARDGPGRLAYLVDYNRVLAWATLGAAETARREFADLCRDHGNSVDWIAYLQVGQRLAQADATEAARAVLDAGKSRFPEQASHFERQLDGG